MEKITEMLTTVLNRLDKLEKKAKKVKKSESETDTEKPKKPLNEGIKAWHGFVKRVREVLKENDQSFSSPMEATQFCSALKAKRGDYELWWNDEILEERAIWEKPEKSKSEIAKSSKKTTPVSSVSGPRKKEPLPASDAEDSAASESEAEPEVKKKPGRPKKVVEAPKKEEKKEEAPKKVGRPKKEVAEKKTTGRPKKVVEEDENYTGGIEAFKHKGVTYAKTDRHDVIDEDECIYIGRWNDETNEIDYSFPEPAYVKKIIAGLKSDDE